MIRNRIDLYEKYKRDTQILIKYKSDFFSRCSRERCTYQGEARPKRFTKAFWH